MKIIVNADDFGHDRDSCDATIECFERGALSSATLMPKMPATEQALDYALRNPRFSFGVHLTYVCDTVEAPLSDPNALSGLVRADGRFLKSNQVRLKALLGRLAVEEIVCETRAQLAAMRDRGLLVSHVDSHGHLHKFRPFREALKIVLPEFGIQRVRNVQDIYLRTPWRSPTFWLGAIWRRKLMRAFKSTTHFYMCTSAGDTHWPETLLSRLAPAGTLEVGVHPGFNEPWRNAEREAAQRFSTLARAAGHELISWENI